MGIAGAIRSVGAQRPALIFLSVTIIVALSVLLRPGPEDTWVLDVLTGIAAGAATVIACVRLSLGAPNAAARRIWMAASVLLGLVCIGQLAAPFGDGAEFSIIVRGVVLLMLAVALALLWRLARFDPMPPDGRLLLWLAFAVQAAAAVTFLPAPDLGSTVAASWHLASDFLALISIQLYLLGGVIFVTSLRRQIFAAQHRASDVGDFARYLFATSGLFKKVRHPRIGNYTVPGHRFAFILVRLLSWFPQIAPRVRARFGIGLWRQFRDLCAVAFRHGLDAQVYYMFELYRAERRARASGYLTRYELKNGLYKVLTWQVSKTKRRIMLGDKLGMHRICEDHGIPSVPILVVAEGGNLEYHCDPRAGLMCDLFIKPRQAKGSRGAEFIRYADGRFTREDGTTSDYEGLIGFIAERSEEEPLLVQPRIANHPGLADLADVALMRIRVITCLDDKGRPVMTHAVLSNLCKLELKWPTDIEIGAAVDLETGALGLVTGDKADMWLDWSEDHPITHAKMFGRIVPCWSQVRDIALAAHAACNDRLLIGWDIAVGPEGALLLEGNSYPDVDFLQRSHQCAIGDSPLGPLLFARLADLERRVTTGTLRGPLDYD